MGVSISDEFSSEIGDKAILAMRYEGHYLGKIFCNATSIKVGEYPHALHRGKSRSMSDPELLQFLTEVVEVRKERADAVGKVREVINELAKSSGV